MRVGVLTTSYPRDDDDPAGGFVAGFARWLAAHVGDVEVCAAGDRGRLFYRGGAPSALAAGGVRAWAEAARFAARLAWTARQRRWDAVVSHWLVPSSLAGMLAGRPHLAIAHGSDVRLLSALPGGRALVRQIAASADLVYVARALAVDGAPGRVQPMGIDVAAWAPIDRAAARRRWPADGFVALYLGRLTREKGVGRLLSALPPGVTLWIAGDGPERARLEAAARGDVRFLGEVRGADKRALLSAADALVLPSRREGAPTVLLEALVAGLPIICTPAGAELVRDGETALLVEPDQLGPAIARVASDGGLRASMSGAGRAAAAAHDWSVVGPTLAGALPRGPAGRISVHRL